MFKNDLDKEVGEKIVNGLCYERRSSHQWEREKNHSWRDVWMWTLLKLDSLLRRDEKYFFFSCKLANFYHLSLCNVRKQLTFSPFLSLGRIRFQHLYKRLEPYFLRYFPFPSIKIWRVRKGAKIRVEKYHNWVSFESSLCEKIGHQLKRKLADFPKSCIDRWVSQITEHWKWPIILSAKDFVKFDMRTSSCIIVLGL